MHRRQLLKISGYALAIGYIKKLMIKYSKKTTKAVFVDVLKRIPLGIDKKISFYKKNYLFLKII